MTKRTILQIIYGVCLLGFMLINMYSTQRTAENYNSYLEKRISYLETDLQQDGLSGNQIKSISSAIRDTNFIQNSTVQSQTMNLAFMTIMGFVVTLSVFNALCEGSKNKDRKN